MDRRSTRVRAPVEGCGWLLVLCCVATGAAEWQSPEGIALAARLEAATLGGVEPAATSLAPGYDVTQLRLPQCPTRLAARGTPAPWMQSRMSIEVQCASPYWRVFVPVAVEARRRVVVLARAVPAGAVLGPSDLQMSDWEAGTLAAGTFADTKDLLGARLLRNTSSGQPIVAGWVRRPPAVRRGQAVTIVAQNAALNIRADGIAGADAQVAERVRVRNRSSGREVEAVVTGNDVVQVTLD